MFESHPCHLDFVTSGKFSFLICYKGVDKPSLKSWTLHESRLRTFPSPQGLPYRGGLRTGAGAARRRVEETEVRQL